MKTSVFTKMSSEIKVFLSEYRIALVNFRNGNQEIEDKARRRALDDEFKLQWAKKAQERGYIPPHDLYVEWDQLLNLSDDGKESAKKIRRIRKYAKIEELFEFREILGLEDISSPEERYFEKEKLKEKMGSDEAAYGYILGIWKTVKRIENEEERKRILESLVKNGVPAFNERKFDHLIRKLNSNLE